MIREREENLRTFLTEDQISVLTKKVYKWKDETIVKGYKLGIALGVHGYEALHGTGYPTPGYRTLTERLRGLQLNFGVFEELQELLQ